MSLLSRLLRPFEPRLRPLYDATVAAARAPAWYLAGVPDTREGRFDMLAGAVALILLRLEAEGGGAARQDSAELTELFVADMDGSLRQMGIGDLVVGKHVGKMMAVIASLLDAFREGAGDTAAWRAAVRRNIFRDAPPSEAQLSEVAARLGAWRDAVARTAMSDLLAGRVPTP